MDDRNNAKLKSTEIFRYMNMLVGITANSWEQIVGSFEQEINGKKAFNATSKQYYAVVIAFSEFLRKHAVLLSEACINHTEPYSDDEIGEIGETSSHVHDLLDDSFDKAFSQYHGTSLIDQVLSIAGGAEGLSEIGLDMEDFETAVPEREKIVTNSLPSLDTQTKKPVSGLN